MMRTKTMAAAAILAVSATLALAQDAVNLMLKNDSGSGVDVELVDQYGGNFTAAIEAGTSQNQTLKPQSEIKVGGTSVHVVVPADEGTEIIIAQ